MDAQPLTLHIQCESNQQLATGIEELESQMSGLDPDSPKYQYDAIHLEIYREEERVRAENPNLDPMNPQDAEKLYKILAQDPTYQDLENRARFLVDMYASESSSWGIPL